MIGTFINRWRREQGISQADLCKRLREHGWPLTPSKLSKMETEADRGIDKRLEFSQVEILVKAMQPAAERWEIYHAAGLMPPEIRETSMDAARARVAMALLYAAAEKPELGPSISYDVALAVGLIPEPASLEEQALLEKKFLAAGAKPPSPDEQAVVEEVREHLPKPEPGKPKKANLRRLYE